MVKESIEKNPLKDLWGNQSFYDKAILVSAFVGIISLFMNWIAIITGISTDFGKIAGVMFIGVIIVTFISTLKNTTKSYIQIGMGLVSLFATGYLFYTLSKAIGEIGDGGDFGAVLGMVVSPQVGLYLSILVSLAIIGIGIYKLKTLPDFKGFSKKQKIIVGVIIVLIFLSLVGNEFYNEWDANRLYNEWNAEQRANGYREITREQYENGGIAKIQAQIQYARAQRAQDETEK